MNTDRRFQAGRPYFRPENKHQISRESDFIFAWTLCVGAMIGATVTLLVVAV